VVYTTKFFKHDSPTVISLSRFAFHDDITCLWAENGEGKTQIPLCMDFTFQEVSMDSFDRRIFLELGTGIYNLPQTLSDHERIMTGMTC